MTMLTPDKNTIQQKIDLIFAKSKKFFISNLRLNNRLTRPLKPLYHLLKDLSIKQKLNTGFGTLVILTFATAGVSYVGNTQARISMKRTEALRVPTVTHSASAQASLLRMLSSLHGYLATGNSDFRVQYQASRHHFEQELIELIQLADQWHLNDHQEELRQLQENYQNWSNLPEQLFVLKDNILMNQPAWRLYDQEGKVIINQILQAVDNIQEDQQGRLTSVFDVDLIFSITEFSNSFTSMIAALQGYITTTNSQFRYEYSFHWNKNQAAWEFLESNQSVFTENQRTSFQTITNLREELKALNQQIFNAVNNERYREDIYLFQTQVEPLATEMLDSLNQIVTEQQLLLTTELTAGNQNLILGQWKALIVGIISLILAILMVSFLRRSIAYPIQRLTSVTTRIMEGNFEVQAKVEFQDEVGKLASTFNQMTAYLKQSHADLEQSKATLEQRVKQRTKEIQEKNIELETTLRQLKDTQAKLIQSEKMSSLGQLVGGVAHEINNPVNFIHANLYHLDQYIIDLLDLLKLYQQELATPSLDIHTKIVEMDLDFLIEDFPQIIHSMQTGTERISQIVTSLRNFSRLDEAEMKGVDIHNGLENTLMLLQKKLKSSTQQPEIQIIKEYGHLPEVECYAGQLNQVFLSLIANAIEALQESKVQQPSITIRTQFLTKNSRIQIQIEDNGKGINPQIQDKLFDPFFTTKPVGQGVGLGLAISYNIIEKHHGSLSVFSEPGQGAIFILEIPIYQTPQLKLIS